ncbi:MAG TPA: toll/interleukin-1 receptor domain-containing protein [Pyrinomonadaceae bacterium]|jgi:hypothetical protein
MQVFISYAESDEPVARKVVAGLEREGLKVWYDRREVLPGQNWAESVAKALKESSAMVVLITRAWLSSPRLQREIDYALSDQSFRHRLVPVFVGPPEKLPKREVPWILQSLKTVSLPERGSPDKGIKEIADTLKAA